MVTGHGNIKAYLYRFKIKDSPTCSCRRGEQTIDYILLNCELVEQERDIHYRPGQAQRVPGS